MLNIYLKVTTEKNWGSQTWFERYQKISERYHWTLVPLVAT